MVRKYVVFASVAFAENHSETCEATFCDDLSDFDAGEREDWSFSDQFGDPKQCLGANTAGMFATSFPNSDDCMDGPYVVASVTGVMVQKDISKPWNGQGDNGVVLSPPEDEDEEKGTTRQRQLTEDGDDDNGHAVGAAWTQDCTEVAAAGPDTAAWQSGDNCARVAAGIAVQRVTKSTAGATSRSAYIEGFEQSVCAVPAVDGKCPATTDAIIEDDILTAVQAGLGGNHIKKEMATGNYKGLAYRQMLSANGFDGGDVLVCIGAGVCAADPFAADCELKGEDVKPVCKEDAAWQVASKATESTDVKAVYFGGSLEGEAAKDHVRFMWVLSKSFNTYLYDIPYIRSRTVLDPYSTGTVTHFVHSKREVDGSGIFYIDYVFPFAESAFLEVTDTKMAFLYAVNKLGNVSGKLSMVAADGGDAANDAKPVKTENPGLGEPVKTENPGLGAPTKNPGLGDEGDHHHDGGDHDHHDNKDDHHQTSASDDDDGLSGGAIAGIIIGVLLGLGLAVGGGYYLYKKKQDAIPEQELVGIGNAA